MSSKIEQAILNALNPIQINANEEVVFNGVKGVVLNKSEFANVKNINQYQLNQDSNPQLIKKKPACCVNYNQEVGVRLLKPSKQPPPPGKIIIRQEPDIQTPAAPPLVVRQLAEKPKTPAPLVVREAPPKTPCPIPEKVITIPGKVLPAPPRKVVIEKLPPNPPKPQNVVIEKWLPFEKQKRQVVFERPCQQPVVSCPPRNLVVEWETPCVEVHKEFKDLGVVLADPEEYRRKYNFTRRLNDLPAVVKELNGEQVDLTPRQHDSELPELEGDLFALRLIDLEANGLGEYKSLIESTASASQASAASASVSVSAPAYASSVSASNLAQNTYASSSAPAQGQCGANASNYY